jgi:cell division protein FtsZ
MKDAGYAHMGVGEATGKEKAELAAKAAISSPLLETSISGARGIIISITASPDIGLEDIDVASTMIKAETAPDANVIFGVAFDPELEDKMKITIVATGFANKAEEAAQKAPAAAVEKKTDDVTDEVVPSSISDDEFNEIIDMLKNRRKGDSAKTGGTQLF